MEAEVETMTGDELVYRASDPGHTVLRDGEDGSPILEGRMMPYEEWTQISSSVEGHFMERFAPGSLAKTMSEQKSRIRALFEHGLDSLLGRQAIAEIQSFDDREDGAYYRASLLDGLPPLILSGLRRGLYGSSIRFRPVKFDRVRSPQPSDHNPDGLPEVTIREGSIREVSVVTFPAYVGATAGIRSLTDEVIAKQLLGDPARLLEILRTTTPTEEASEPPHSGPDESQEAPVVVGSRRTQPQHDWLNPKQEEDWWRL